MNRKDAPIEQCVECGKSTGLRLSGETKFLTGSIICKRCVKRLGLPTLEDLFGGKKK